MDWFFLTALHWAVMSNNHNVIRILLKAGSSMDALNAEVQENFWYKFSPKGFSSIII